MNIAVAGTGYVGLSLATLLGQKHHVVAVDVIPEKVEMINKGQSPIDDKEIKSYLEACVCDITATTDGESAYRDADFVIVATPTNYDTGRNYFDTTHVEEVIDMVLKVNPDAVIVIKSTIPVGYVSSLYFKYYEEGNVKKLNLLFSPEFLREGKALYDNLYPSRIIVGVPQIKEMTDFNKTNNAFIFENEAIYALADLDFLMNKAHEFANMIKDCGCRPDVPMLFIGTTEAEAVKLFANTYLAMRVAYFNELDTYAEMKGLNTKDIIDGMCLDPRIGNYYNNPSFGYGGYCLPKDSKQMKANYIGVPQDLIKAIVDSNNTRKDFIAYRILQKGGYYDVTRGNSKEEATIGIYRLTMKTGSDNFRESAIMRVIDKIQQCGARIVIYEPAATKDKMCGWPVIKDLEVFKKISGVIVANRYDKELDDVRDKVYTRDFFERD